MIKMYIRYRVHILIFYILVIILFPFMQMLFHYPAAAMWYSVEIFTFLFLVFIAIDSERFYRKHQRLKKLRKALSTYEIPLPDSQHVIEEDYQEIIKDIVKNFTITLKDTENEKREEIEYYTMWMHQIKIPIAAMHLIFQSQSEEIFFRERKLLEQELFQIERYVEMALEFLKIQTLESDLVLEEYSLSEIIRQSVKKYATMFIYKKITIQIEAFEYQALTDNKWLSFIIEQIISNAIKYTREGQGKIRIFFEREVHGGRLKIEDNGIGIRKEDLPRIFEKGYTGYNGRLDKKASGLGLYLVKKVSRALNHSVIIFSELGKGTMVEIKFSDKVPEDFE